ncbi:MAG: DUF167 domain-containing protein [Gammaproteobacteria bacterium]|nr:DUF167 domain-containing protein [Gammaproteobacteria bacterium]
MPPTNQPKEPKARLSVKVTPRASRNEVVGWVGGKLKVKVAAAPEGGRANDALAAFLAERLGLPRRSVRVATGHTSSSKIVEIAGIRQADLVERFGPPGG